VPSDSKIAVLVVEDEEPIRNGLCDVLSFHGYRAEAVERGDEGLRRAASGEHALVLLDVMLPGLSGFDVCERLRGSGSQLPVLMLTARGSEEDVLRGFRAGADDYVVKPFSVRELTARVEALLRRSGALQVAAARSLPPKSFRFGDWQIEAGSLCARAAGAQGAPPRVVDLTPRDVEILSLLARERGRIVSRRALLLQVWGYPDPERVETRSVDMHIAKLRRKLGDGEATLIETVRGAGYRHPA
jgi:two-component system response regulator RegX3